jgi:[CysO sulfur-carrier protein]-S-L-cysteine hydrolase
MGQASPEPVHQLVVPSGILESMIDHCRKAHPNEACGVLAGKDMLVSEIFRMTNIESSPLSYLMDPAEQFEMLRELRTKSLSMIAIYHSHPCAPAFPSSIDIERALYEEAIYVIVSFNEGAPAVQAFSIKGGEVADVGITTEF